MKEAAGGQIYSKAAGKYIKEYILGDMTSTVYPVGGGMEDWGYGAAWDTVTNAGMAYCTPQTQPTLEDSFFESQENIRSAVYLIETDDQKNPLDVYYGSRTVIYSDHSDGGY